MRVIVIGGGSFFPLAAAGSEDFVICADSGYDSAKANGIKADLIIGDMDSVKSDLTCEKNKLVYPARKDFTDGELAVRHAVSMNPSEIVLLGFTGTRLDHTLTNISLLRLIYNSGIKGCLLDGNNTVYYYRGFFEIKNMRGKTVSLVPISERIEKIYTEGLEYPLFGEDLVFGQSRGVSNIVTADRAFYRSEGGDGLLIFSVD